MRSSKAKRKARRQSRHEREDSLRELKQRTRANLGDNEVSIVESSDGVKMSEVIEDFIAPYMHVADTEIALRKLLSIALVAWNASLLPEDRQEAAIEELVTSLPPDAREDARAIIKELLIRKQRHFAHFRRSVIDFHVTDLGDGFHLAVVSTPDDV